jgi:hypothetical protein
MAWTKRIQKNRKQITGFTIFSPPISLCARKNITIELESSGEKGSITPTPINLWIIIAVFIILVGRILLGLMLFRKKQMMRMMKR